MVDETVAADYLLIARKNGSSSGRRQRRFADMAQVERAIARWRLEGFTAWWIFVPRESEDDADPPRRLAKHWVD